MALPLLPPDLGPAVPIKLSAIQITVPAGTVQTGFNCPLFPGYTFAGNHNFNPFVGSGVSLQADTLYQAYLTCTAQSGCTAFNSHRQLTNVNPLVISTTAPASTEPSLPACAGLYVKMSECASWVTCTPHRMLACARSNAISLFLCDGGLHAEHQDEPACIGTCALTSG